MTKRYFRNILNRAGLLGITQSIIYWFTRFDADTTHPRRLMRRFYAQFIKKDDLCFDIGANLGNRTRMFLELGAKVICVEPQKKCLDKLYRLFGRNSNVIIVSKGVASEEGIMDLAICKDEPAISTLSERFKKESMFAVEYGYCWQENERIVVTTLDSLISQYGMPAFCKIDVEGFEKEAFRGLTRPVPLVSFEFQSRFLDEAAECLRILSFIAPYRFNFATAEPTSGRGLELPEWVNLRTLSKKLDVLKKDDPNIWGDIYARL